MCGRYALSAPVQRIVDYFTVREFFEDEAGPDLRPRYNIAPTQRAPVIRLAEGERVLQMMRWGFVPHWAKDPAALKSHPINARAEKASRSPMFRDAFRHHRCLVPATGFYEWRKRGKGQPKQPYLIRREDERPFAFAGLCSFRPEADDEALAATFTILTTEPNELVRPIHDRMPVILPEDRWQRWLSASAAETGELEALITGPPSAERWEAVPVSRRVNSPAHDDAKLVEPLGDGGKSDADPDAGAPPATLFG